MKAGKHTVLLVDDEENILNSLRRMLRKEPYQLFTSSSAREAFKILRTNKVHLIISDNRMPGTDGIDFLAKVKEKYPDAIRIILTGYTDVDAITESINKGHIYKFFLKPWNDDNLKLEIRKALEQYELIQENIMLDKKVVEQNRKLKEMNEHLEELVRERTIELELRNMALELSHAILEDLPLAIMGVSADSLIVLMNNRARTVLGGDNFLVGNEIEECFPAELCAKIKQTIENGYCLNKDQCNLEHDNYMIEVIPLSGRFKGQGGLLTFRDKISC